MVKKKKSADSQNLFPTINETKKSNWLILIPSLISIVAIIIAIFANQIARDANKLSIQANTLANQANEIYKNEIYLTHRPYVWIGDFAYLDEENSTVPDPSTVQLVVINSPARLVSESYRHYAVKGDEIIEIEKKYYNTRILYPSDKTQDTYTIEQSSQIKCKELLGNGYELFREAKIEYQMLSKKEKYKYEAKWKFNNSKGGWQLTDSPIAD